MNRLLIEPSALDPDGRAQIAGDAGRHLVRVLGVSPGGRVRAGILDGPTGQARIESVRDETVEIVFEPDPHPIPRGPIDLLLAAPRPKVMKRLWAQLAALGVDRILITGAARVEPFYFDSHAYTESVWRPRLIEGLAQSGQTRVPHVSIDRSFRRAVELTLDTSSDAECRLVLHPGEPDLLISTPNVQRRQRSLLAIGPEGGWTEHELSLLSTRRFHRVGMGTRILRTDTACLAALSILGQRLEFQGDESD